MTLNKNRGIGVRYAAEGNEIDSPLCDSLGDDKSLTYMYHRYTPIFKTKFDLHDCVQHRENSATQSPLFSKPPPMLEPMELRKHGPQLLIPVTVKEQLMSINGLNFTISTLSPKGEILNMRS
jgi:hypothetical protein